MIKIIILLALCVILYSFVKRILGLLMFLFLIVGLYYHGTDPKNEIYSKLSSEEIESYRGHFNNSILTIDCKNDVLITKSLDNGKIYTHENKIKNGVFIDILNEYARIVIKNPKCGEFEIDTFRVGEIKIVDSHHFVDYKRGGQTLEFR
jgi:hypothetical protein